VSLHALTQCKVERLDWVTCEPAIPAHHEARNKVARKQCKKVEGRWPRAAPGSRSSTHRVVPVGVGSAGGPRDRWLGWDCARRARELGRRAGAAVAGPVPCRQHKEPSQILLDLHLGGVAGCQYSTGHVQLLAPGGALGARSSRRQCVAGKPLTMFCSLMLVYSTRPPPSAVQAAVALA
jgi:hypothetical protein